MFKLGLTWMYLVHLSLGTIIKFIRLHVYFPTGNQKKQTQKLSKRRMLLANKQMKYTFIYKVKMLASKRLKPMLDLFQIESFAFKKASAFYEK